MKKILLSLVAAGAATFSAGAEKVVFIASDAFKFYDGDAQTIVNIPNGYYLTTPNDRAPEKAIKKSLSSSVIKIDASGAGDFGFKTVSKENKCYSTSGSWRWYTNQGMTFTPAKGITMKGIKIRSQRFTAKTTPGNYVYPFTKNAEDTKMDVSNVENIILFAELNSAEAMVLQPTGQLRCFYIEVEYEGTLAQPSMPDCSARKPFVAADEELALNSDTGADIYYTLDGSVPTTSSTKYSSPFKLTEDCVLRAIAVKDGVESFPFYAEYFQIPAGTKVDEFDMSNWESLTKKDGSEFKAADFLKKDTDTEPCNMWINMNGVELAGASGSLLSFKDVGDKQTQIFKSWTFGNVVEYRPNDAANTFTATVPEGCTLSNVVIVGSNIADTETPLKLADGEKGTFALSPINKANAIWKAGDNELSAITFAGGTYIDQIYVIYKENESGSGVVGIEADENAPVEYYNLQGVRVASSEKGLYIVKQGNKVEKRFIK